MPHYKDGTEAKVGDQVIGKLYNTVGIRAGTLISITKGTEACNAQVAFTEAVAIDNDSVDIWRGLEKDWTAEDQFRSESRKVPSMARWKAQDSSSRPVFRVVLGENHGSTGAPFAVFDCVDYTGVCDLTKV
jgi:hypothetical protein